MTQQLRTVDPIKLLIASMFTLHSGEPIKVLGRYIYDFTISRVNSRTRHCAICAIKSRLALIFALRAPFRAQHLLKVQLQWFDTHAVNLYEPLERERVNSTTLAD